MARLLLTTPVGGTSEIVLNPGRNQIGRDSANDHPLDDASVSSTHCEVVLNDGIATIKDLGSTNGTFLDSMQVDQAELRHGQKLTLGTVEMVFEGDDREEAAAVSSAPRLRVQLGAQRAQTLLQTHAPAAAPRVAGPGDCPSHPGTRAVFVCRRCRRGLCGECVKTTRVGMQALHACPDCDGICIKADDYQKELARKQMTFFNSFLGSFVYPLKRNGPMLLVCGTLFFGLLAWMRDFFTGTGLTGGLVYWFLLVVGVGYLFLYLESVIATSAMGEEDMPGWPEFTGYYEDLVKPFFRLVATFAACLAPGLVIISQGHTAAGFAFLLTGFFVLPMALLTVAMISSLSGLNPFVIFPSILKVPIEYLMVCGVLLLIFGLQVLLEFALSFARIPLLSAALSMFLWLYGVTVAGRILGLLYYTKSRKLAWF